MGEYLAKPDKNKDIQKDSNEKIKYVAMGMQGWRRSMEDSHIADLKMQGGNCLFGVFDGHGGSEVAIFVKNHFSAEL